MAGSGRLETAYARKLRPLRFRLTAPGLVSTSFGGANYRTGAIGGGGSSADGPVDRCQVPVPGGLSDLIDPEGTISGEDAIPDDVAMNIARTMGQFYSNNWDGLRVHGYRNFPHTTTGAQLPPQPSFTDSPALMQLFFAAGMRHASSGSSYLTMDVRSGPDAAPGLHRLLWAPALPTVMFYTPNHYRGFRVITFGVCNS